MMAAEQWRKYQEDYTKYGIDMRPKEQKEKEEHIEKYAGTMVVSPRERKLLLLTIAVVAMCCVACIFVNAGASQIEYNINELAKEQNVVTGEIENLNVEIMSKNTIGYIEEYATTQLGMVYPSQVQYVNVTDTDQNVDGYITTLTATQKGAGSSVDSSAYLALASVVKSGNAGMLNSLAG